MSGEAAMSVTAPSPSAAPATRAPTDWRSDAMRRRIERRYASERRFRLLGLGAILISGGFLLFLIVSMMASGLRGFTQTQIALPVDFARAPILLDPATLSANPDQVLANANLPSVIDKAAEDAFGAEGAKLLSPGDPPGSGVDVLGGDREALAHARVSNPVGRRRRGHHTRRGVNSPSPKKPPGRQISTMASNE